MECRFEGTITEDPSPDLKLVELKSLEQTPSQCWKLYVDGSSTQEENGAGILFTSSEGQIYQYGLRFGFPATNNVVEY